MSEGSEFRDRSEQQVNRLDAHNQRVRAFANRPDLEELSPREYGDAYAEALRPQNIEMLCSFERMGLMAPRAERHARLREDFQAFGFLLEPASGWDAFLFELDLIFVQFDVPDLSKGYAKLRREVDLVVARLEELQSKLIDFNHNIDFTVAAMLSKADTNDHFLTIGALIRSHKTVSAWLAENAQPPRWRDKTLREKRVELATKLLTLFNREFGQLPKPDGGSAHIPIDDANDWQRFFQACAFVRLGERETPDRQAVLWEAHRNW